MTNAKTWTDCKIAAKAEWEGLDYLLTDIDPDMVDDQQLADWLRVGRVAWEQVRDRINRMTEACGGEDCELCGGLAEQDELDAFEEGVEQDDLDQCPTCDGFYDPDEDENECSCDEDEEDDGA